MSNFFDPSAKENLAVLDYFENKTWLIVDSSASTRTSIKKSVSQLGPKISSMLDCDNLTDAMALIETKKPNFIIGNKTINNGSTIDLFELHLKMVPNRLNAGFYVITEENSLSEVAAALNYDMEGLISIPFTGQAIINTVLAGVKHKINPSPYIKKLYMALEIMIKGDLDSALETFDEAQKMHQHPYEALYYLGEIYKSKGLTNEALTHYELAYTHNPKHYKTLRDLSALYYQQKNYKMAYEFNVQMAQSYPIPPERIPELIRLSIINQKYPDIINYLKIFDSLKSPNDELKNSLAAGLAILGKHFFILNENDNACEALKRAFTYSNGKYEVLKNISKTFQDMNKSDVLLNAFDNIDLSQWPDNAEGIYFQTLNLVSKDDGAVINYAEKLLKRKIYDVVIYKGMIERGIKIKRKIGVIEGQVFEAIKNFPAHKDEFEELLAEAKKELAS